MNATYRIMNKPLTICGADRRMFLGGLLLAYITWTRTGSVPIGLAVFAIMVVLGRIHAKDPTRIPLAIARRKYFRRYTPRLGRAYHVHFHDDLN